MVTFFQATYVLATIFINANIFSDTNSFLKEILTQNFVEPEIYFGPKIGLDAQFFLDPKFS